jgi:hypothetical protein
VTRADVDKPHEAKQAKPTGRLIGVRHSAQTDLQSARPTAAALVNAVADATGIRIRELPFTRRRGSDRTLSFTKARRRVHIHAGSGDFACSETDPGRKVFRHR